MVRRKFREGLQQAEVLKVTILARIAMRTTPIPVTVGTLKGQQKQAWPKVTTVIRMEMRTTPIPEAVRTFEMQ